MRQKILILSLCLLLVNPIQAQAKEEPEEYQNYIEGVAETYGICPELIEAICFYESSWTESAVNGSCTGLMQVDSKIHKSRCERLGVTDLSNGYQNILVGTDYLAELFDTYEDPALVLDAYNGQLKATSWYEQGNMSAYSKKVLALSEKLERENGK